MNTKDYIDQYMTETMEIVNTVDRGERAPCWGALWRLPPRGPSQEELSQRSGQ